jgi:protein-disulfide isomerase
MSTPLRVTMGRLTLPVIEEDHIRGPASAPVTLLEYGDYECPYCAAAHPMVLELLRQRSDTVRYAYRHFPLTNVHPHAELAAEVAETAGEHDKFWPTHDWFFDNHDLVVTGQVLEGVAEVGLPATAVARDLGEHRHLDRIRRDFVSGIRSGVNGTPTFFVNGVRHDGGYSLDDLLAAVDDA